MSLLLRVLLFIFCGAAGYCATIALIGSDRQLPREAVSKSSSATPPPAPSAGMSLIAEWEQLRQEHGTTLAELPALYTAVKDIKNSFRRRAFRAALIAEWAGADPRAALAFLQAKDKGNATQLMREWLRLDPQGAVTGLLAGGAKNQSGLRTLLSDIARLAPARLGEVVGALPKSSSRWDTTAQDAFAILAQNDPDAARAAAQSITGPLRGQALAGVARAWAEKDGSAALAWAQTIPAGEDRDAALKATLIGWAKTDPAAALDKIDLVPPGGEEMYSASDVGAQVLREAAKRDWDGTVRWLRDHPGKLGRSSLDGLQSIVSQRLTVDPSETLRSLSQSGLPGLDHVLANSFLNEGYMQKDAAWQWLDRQPETSFTRSVRRSLLNAIGWKEPDLALEFLEKLPATPENRELLEQGTRSLINGGSQMDRFEDLLAKASPKIRPYLLETGFDYGVQKGDSNLARWVDRLSELPEDRRGGAIARLASGWAANDPESAINWATSLRDPMQREQALSAATGTWVATDVEEASDWINSLPLGATRDTATQTLVGALARSAPETSWTWAMTIQTPEQRRSALQMAYMAMRKKDPAIAQQMVRTANLSMAESKALLELQTGSDRADGHVAKPQ